MRLLFDQNNGLTEALTLVRGINCTDASGRVIRPILSVIFGIGVHNSAVLQTDKRALSTSWISFSGMKKGDLFTNFFHKLAPFSVVILCRDAVH